MPDLLITDDLVYRCAEAAFNAGRAYLGRPRPARLADLPARLADLPARSQEQWLTEARAVLVEALK